MLINLESARLFTSTSSCTIHFFLNSLPSLFLHTSVYRIFFPNSTLFHRQTNFLIFAFTSFYFEEHLTEAEIRLSVFGVIFD